MIKDYFHSIFNGIHCHGFCILVFKLKDIISKRQLSTKHYLNKAKKRRYIKNMFEYFSSMLPVRTQNFQYIYVGYNRSERRHSNTEIRLNAI